MNNILDFGYECLPTVGAARGILLAWRLDRWALSDVVWGRFSVSAKVRQLSSDDEPWWLTTVYGPQRDAEKIEFLAELSLFHASVSGPWFVCGDFNMIHRAEDNNNDRLDRRCMQRFRCFINSELLEEIALLGRRFT